MKNGDDWIKVLDIGAWQPIANNIAVDHPCHCHTWRGDELFIHGEGDELVIYGEAFQYH